MRRAGLEPRGVLEVGLAPDPELVVLGEQRQQLAAGEVDVVPDAADDEHDVDSPARCVGCVAHAIRSRRAS